jgi:hypothetical protein
MLNLRNDPERKNPIIISFRTMRRLIGILGISLPVILFTWSVLLTGSHFLLDSISSYYHTNLRDVFVGILCAVSLFLFSYHGYDLGDFITFKIASVSALGVAFFPAFIKSETNPYIHIAPNVSAATNCIHYISAAVFFLTLAYISLVLFTRSHPQIRKEDRTRQKLNRNRVYRVCGVTILACIALLLLIDRLPPDSALLKVDPVFWIETIALFAFGVSWLIKGEVAMRDKVGKPL